MDDHLVTSSHEALPNYTLRVSKRAKRMHLKVDHWGKVEVVIPRNVSSIHVEPFVRSHSKWLARTLAYFSQECEGSIITDRGLPNEIHLLSLGENWQISYRQGLRPIFHASTDDAEEHQLRIDTIEATSVRTILQSWIHDYARQRLLPWLRHISEECHLPYARANIRAQKTRWGSCSAARHINLNRYLLFLPPHLVRYIMIHELCHTIHLNHSRRYWALVNRFAPEYQALELELRGAVRHIPRWASPE